MTDILHSSGWELCDHCQAPLAERQRYCVACGTRRAQADDPAARYFAAAARRARAGASAGAAASARPAAGTVPALIVALLPLAVAVGVLVGRGGSSGDEQILKALAAQKAPVVNIGATTGTAGTAAVSGATGAASVTSDFPAAGGFAVSLQTLPVSGTTAADVAAAVKALQAKKAPDVAVVSPSDFRVTPGSRADVYSLVSGHFTSKAGATRALRALRKRFPKATVVHVLPKSEGAAAASGAGRVLATGPAGDAHQLEGSEPTSRQRQEGAKAVEQINNSKGKEYVDSQRNLPDTIVVP